MTVNTFLSFDEFMDKNPGTPLDIVQRFGVNIRGDLDVKPNSCHYLTADGIIGPKTRGGLYVDLGTENAALSVGFKEVLLRAEESSAGNNTGPFVHKYFRIQSNDLTRPRGAWCAAFASWVLREAYGHKAVDSVVGARPFGAHALGVDWARAPGQRVQDLSLAQPGDLAIWKHPLKWNGHVGIVYGITKLPGSDLHFLTVLEGNGNANRGQVRMYAYPIELGAHLDSLRMVFLARRSMPTKKD